MLAKAKLASSITFIVLSSFTIVTYDRQNMFIIQATGYINEEVNCTQLSPSVSVPLFDPIDNLKLVSNSQHIIFFVSHELS